MVKRLIDLPHGRCEACHSQINRILAEVCVEMAVRPRIDTRDELLRRAEALIGPEGVIELLTRHSVGSKR